MIIVASNSDVLRELLARVLEHEGYSVQTALDPETLVRSAGMHAPDGIVMDIELARARTMNPIRVLQRNPSTSQLPILLIGDPHGKSELRELIAGNVRCVVTLRGFRTETFLDKMRSLLSLGGESATSLSSVGAPGTGRESAGNGNTGNKERRIAGSSIRKLTKKTVQDQLAGMQLLPAHEFIITESLMLAATKGIGTQGLVQVVQRDPGLAANVLHRAAALNAKSSRPPAASIPKAMEALGVREFCKLVEAIPPHNTENNVRHLATVRGHNVATGRIAHMLAEKLQLGDPDTAYCAGLLHDLGHTLLISVFPDHFETLLQAMDESELPPFETETKIVGVHHGELGAWSCERFGLPENITDAVLMHHSNSAERSGLRSSSRLLAMIVETADSLANALAPTDSPLSVLSAIPAEMISALSRAGVSTEEITTGARNAVNEVFAEVSQMVPAAGAMKLAEKPVNRVAYHAPGKLAFDPFRMWLQDRSDSLIVLGQLGGPVALDEIPMVVALSHVTETDAQTDALNAVRNAKLFDDRSSIVLAGNVPSQEHRKLAGSHTRFVVTPTHPQQWLNWLSESQNVREAAACS